MAHKPNLFMAINSRKDSAPLTPRPRPFAPPGHARVAPIRAMGELIRSLGGDADAVFRAAKVDEHVLADPDGVLPVAVRGELMERAARETGCEHFGLLLVANSGIRELGVAGKQMLGCPNVGLALEAFAAFWLLHNQSGVVFVGRNEDQATLGYAVMDGSIPGIPQLQDGVLSFALNIMRDMLGNEWHPTGVNLMRHEPRDPAVYAQFFGASCRFNAVRSELVFPAATLDFRLKNPDTEGVGLVLPPLDESEWSGCVKRLAYRLLLEGDCSQIRVAAALGISSRTLVRKLGIAGMSYKQLLEWARFSASRTWLRETNLTLAEIAVALGYNEASSFTRAFQRWSGMSPSSWRKLKIGPASLPSGKK